MLMPFLIGFIIAVIAAYTLWERYQARKFLDGWRAETKAHSETIEAYEYLHREWATCLLLHKITLTRNGVPVIPLDKKDSDDWPEYVN